MYLKISSQNIMKSRLGFNYISICICNRMDGCGIQD